MLTHRSRYAPRMLRTLGVLLAFLLVAAACGDDDAARPAAPSGGVFTISNQGGTMEGHTPRGFPGMGTGLFAGDDLNPGFPAGDGVQIYLTFDLSPIPQATIRSAVLAAAPARIAGSPFDDLGALRVEAVRYDTFGPHLFDLAAIGGTASCGLAESAEGPFQCDLRSEVQRALDEGNPAQFRVLFERSGDGDGQPDLAMFFVSDSNTNEPGIFTLTVDAG